MSFKNISTILFAGVLFLASCKKEVNEDLLEPPSYSEFGTPNLQGKYFILSAPSPSFKIPVGITNVSGEDRTIQFTYRSPTGAVAGTHYTAPTSIVIPAGKALDSLAIQGIFANYPVGRKDSLFIKISGGDVDINTYNNEYLLIMQKYCDVIFANLAGNYTNTRHTNSSGGSPVGPYTSSLSGMTLVSPTSGTATANNLRLTNNPLALDPIQLQFNWADPANFSVTIPMQYSGWDYDVNQPIYIRTSPGQISTFSSCDQSISLIVDFIVDNYPAPGSAAFFASNYRITMRR